MAFFYESIENRNQKKYLIYLLKKMRKELINPRNQTTLYLSYRLFKSFMKREPEKKEMFCLIFF